MTPHHILHKLTGRIAWLIVLLSLPIFAIFILGQAVAIQQQAVTSGELSGDSSLYLPIVIKSEPPTPTATPTASPIATIETVTCDIPEQTYELIPIKGSPEDRPDNNHADLNLALRSYEITNEWLGLVDYDGDTDAAAPQLYGLFADNRTPAFTSLYQVYDWNWSCDCRGDLISEPWPVTLAGMGTTAGETIGLPNRQGGDIYQGRFKAVVIYAAKDRITLKYTRDDDVVQGYTIHVENICVEPRLVDLYRQGDDNTNRTQLPALAPGQPFGRATGSHIGVVIRDNGFFMDPRSRKDWWQNRPLDTPTPTATAQSSPTATPTATPTLTPIATSTATPTLTPIATSTATPIPSATATTEVSCEIEGQSYELIPIKGSPDDRPDDQHADLNLALRSYEITDEWLGLVDYDGDTDVAAPQLYGLFADARTPAFTSVYQVYDWNWPDNEQGNLITNPVVTLGAMGTTVGEAIQLPDRQGGDIYQGRFKAVVIYAADDRITLKYTRDDDVVQGYTIHVEDICVEPDLVALYRQGDDEHGRSQLPALAPGQPFGRASGSHIGVVIRDNGSFMDPRSRKDWWQNRPLDTPTPTATAQSSPTTTPTSASGSATATATPTLTPIATSTATPTFTPIVTSTATPTLTPTAMPTTVSGCEIEGQSYELIPIKGSPDDRPDDQHADLNLELRGYEPTSAELGLVDYTGDTDPQAPQLYGLFADQRTPAFSNVYKVYNWNWDCNCQGDLIEEWPVTLAGMVTTAGETIGLPDRQGGDIYQGRFKAVVIYAEDDRITLKYTRDDDVVQGYTIHVEDVCVEPDLVALYRQGDDDHGRTQLPALAPGQPFGRANGSQIGVVIRDNGSFMDPRSRKDWWQGR